MKQLWYKYVCGSPWRGWMWVLVGRYGLRAIPSRYTQWRDGWRKCRCCQHTINIGTQVGIEWEWWPLENSFDVPKHLCPPCSKMKAKLFAALETMEANDA